MYIRTIEDLSLRIPHIVWVCVCGGGRVCVGGACVWGCVLCGGVCGGGHVCVGGRVCGGVCYVEGGVGVGVGGMCVWVSYVGGLCGCGGHVCVGVLCGVMWGDVWVWVSQIAGRPNY